MKWRARTAVAFVTVAGFAGCADVDKSLPPPEEMNRAVLQVLPSCNSREAMSAAINSLRDFTDFWNQRCAGSVPDIDFRTSSVVAFFEGPFNSGQKTINILGAAEGRGHAAVYYRATIDQTPVQVVSYPGQAVIIERLAGDVHFRPVTQPVQG